MNSKPLGDVVSHSEVTSIEALGFWLLVDDREYFVPFEGYPVFQEATVSEILDVRRLSPTQFHWPALDADIELDALEHPERFPLVFRPQVSEPVARRARRSRSG